MRLSILSSSLLLCLGCPTTPTVQDTSEPEDTQESNETGTPVTPVWENLSLETSTTLTAAYSSGAGLYAVTEGGECWLRQNNQWRNVPIEVDGEDLNGVWGAGQGTSMQMVTVGDAGYVAEWVEGAWESQDLGTPNFEAIGGVQIDDLIAVGWGGVYRSGPDGWNYESIDGNPRLNHVWYNGAMGVAVGEEGNIATYAQGNWNVTQDSSRKRLYGVTGLPTGEIIAVGEEGTVLHNIGGIWEQRDAGTDVSLWAISAFDANNVIAVGNNGTAIHYDGTEWSPLPTGIENNLYGVAISMTGTAWAVGNRGATIRMQL